jgi:transcriptional regulator with XRE-family HTH domain
VSDFAGRLKELRQAAGLSQKQLAEAAGVSQRAVSHWEQALRSPSWDNVTMLARVLGVSCEAFNQPTAAVAEPSAAKKKAKRN